MVLSTYGWIDGITSTIILFFGVIMAIHLYYKWKMTRMQTHILMAFMMLFCGLMYLGVFLDFLAVLLTDHNIKNDQGQVALLSYVWYPILLTLTLSFFADILMPKKKYYFIIPFSMLSIFFYVAIFSDTSGSFNFEYPQTPGNALINYSLNSLSMAGLYAMMGITIGVIFMVFGLIPKCFKFKGEIRRKYLDIIIGILLIWIGGLTEVLLETGFLYIIFRGLYIFGYYLYYLGLQPIKEYSDDQESTPTSTFFTEKLGISFIKPKNITEEEVSVSKEKKICLVCKGKISGHNYVCSECETFYCNKCYNALTNLENACWACDTQLDKSKPIKSFKKEEEVEVEISEKAKK